MTSGGDRGDDRDQSHGRSEGQDRGQSHGRSHGQGHGRARGVARRDRHGRGLRGQLVPPTVPLSRSRSQQFDDMVLDAVEHLEHRWSAELAGVEFAVEDVPPIENVSPDVSYGTDVVEDGNVPLARLLPTERDRQGRMSPPRIVIYRRPLETRSQDMTDLADLVHDVVVEQVANLLGRDPDEIDPMD